MIILQSMDRFDDLAELDVGTGQIIWISRRENPLAATLPVRGAIAQVQGRTLCLYRAADALIFRVDDRNVELTEETLVRLDRVGGDMNRITVLRQGVPLFTWTYQRPVLDPPLANDPTPFIEEEDFDFCLFVFNVANDPVRRERIYR